MIGLILCLLSSVCVCALAEKRILVNEGNGVPSFQELEQQVEDLFSMVNNMKSKYDVLNRDYGQLEQQYNNLNLMLTTQNKQQEQQMQLLQSKIKEPVVFYSQLGKKKTGLNPNQVIICDHVTTNVGNAYDNTTGVFTCRWPGSYLFIGSLLVDAGHNIDVKIMKNSAIVGHLYAQNSNSWAFCTGTAIMDLQEGDTVRMQIHQNYYHHSVLVEDGFTSFSGFRIQ